MTLLQFVQAACNELGLTAPTAVIGATDQQTIQLLALANGLGNQLVTDYQWQKISKTHTFTLETDSQNGTTTNGSAVITGLSDTSGLDETYQVSGSNIPTDAYIVSVDSATQITMNLEASGSDTAELTFTKTIYDLPSDWNFQINRTHWDRTNHWELIGPKSPQEWEWLKGAIVSTGPRVRYRILANKFQIWPLQVNTATLAYEYISTSWIYAAAAATPTKSAFTVDTDTTIFRDRLMIDGLKLKLWEIKGFDTTKLERSYMLSLEKEMAQDKGAPTLTLSPTYDTILISPANVPDGNVYGQA